MKIAIGSDHGGYRLKQAMTQTLSAAGYVVVDFGCLSEDSMDYPDVAIPLSRAVAGGEYERGILICTTGIGMSIAANKVRGIRCALCTSELQARLTREHNDTNVLALGAGVTGAELAKSIIDIWINTPFSGETRHERRISKMTEYETEHEGGIPCQK